MKAAKPFHHEAIAAAVADYDKAKSDLADHKSKIRDIETRIAEIDVAITETFAANQDAPSFNSLTIDEIKKLADGRLSVTHHANALIIAKDEATSELASLNRDVRGFELLIQGAREGCWRLARNELIKSLDRGLIKKLVATGYMCGMGSRQIIESIIDDTVDYSALVEINEIYGLPI